MRMIYCCDVVSHVMSAAYGGHLTWIRRGGKYYGAIKRNQTICAAGYDVADF